MRSEKIREFHRKRNLRYESFLSAKKGLTLGNIKSCLTLRHYEVTFLQVFQNIKVSQEKLYDRFPQSKV